MTDLEISKALALAIGWKVKDISYVGQHLIVWNDDNLFSKEFDYRDWAVIGPIAERYKCFPFKDPWYKWIAGVGGYPKVFADTPQKTIALAVIGAKK